MSEDYCSQARQWLQHDPRMPERVTTQRSKTGKKPMRRFDQLMSNTPDSLGLKLSEEEAKLYSLFGIDAIIPVSERPVAEDSVVSRSGEKFFWQARGQVVVFKDTLSIGMTCLDSQLPSVEQRRN